MAKRGTKTQPLPQPVASIPADKLLHPSLRNFAEAFRTGGLIRSDTQSATPITWDEQELACIDDGVREGFQTGTFEPLANLLKRNPWFIAHTVIVIQLLDLKKLAWCIEYSDSFPLSGYEEVYPNGTRQAAREALLTVFQGMWSAFFPGGFLKVKVPKARGRLRHLGAMGAGRTSY